MEAPGLARVALSVLSVGLVLGLGVLSLSFFSPFAHPRPAPEDHQHDVVRLRLLTFNIQLGGDVDNVAHVIRTVDADIVALQEPEGNLSIIAGKLGWYYDLTTHILSKHPIVSTPQSTPDAALSYVIVDGADGVVCVCNLHLTPYPYGPDMAREGASVADILRAEESFRLPAVRRLIEAVSHLGQVPTFVLGDFNSPSHLDWTQETVGLRPQMTVRVRR